MNARPRLTVALDCADPVALGDFWGEVLDRPVLPLEGAYVALPPPDGDGPVLLLQRVPEPKAGKNRMHLDVHVDPAEQAATVARLIELGATRISAEDFDECGCRWTVMADPEGNEFCVCGYYGADSSDAGSASAAE